MLEFDYDSFWCWWQIYQWLWRQVAILVLLLITNNNIIENVFKNNILTHWPTRSKLYISTVIILLVVQKCFDHFVFFGRNLNISIAICQLLCCFIICDGYIYVLLCFVWHCHCRLHICSCIIIGSPFLSMLQQTGSQVPIPVFVIFVITVLIHITTFRVRTGND